MTITMFTVFDFTSVLLSNEYKTNVSATAPHRNTLIYTQCKMKFSLVGSCYKIKGTNLQIVIENTKCLKMTLTVSRTFACLEVVTQRKENNVTRYSDCVD